MPDEEPEQRPDAAPRTAPATKAAAKKAPAKKAATKAPAKKAVKRAAPRATIMHRIQELEERMSGEPVDLPAAPLVRVPRPASVAAPDAAPAEPADPTEVIALAPVVPVLEAPAVLPPAPPPPVLPPALPRANPRGDLGPPSPEAGADARMRGERSGLVRAMAVGVVLLLSVAAGLGTAAFVKNRPSTWHAESVVAITPPLSGTASESTGDAAVRYLKTATSRQFASDAAALGGIPGDQVRGELKAREGKAGEVVLDARAVNADVAAALAEAASRQLVLEILKDQAERTDAPSRMGARVLVPTTAATRLQPTDRAVLLGGTLAAVDIMLVAVMLGILLQRPSRRRR